MMGPAVDIKPRKRRALKIIGAFLALIFIVSGVQAFMHGLLTSPEELRKEEQQRKEQEARSERDSWAYANKEVAQRAVLKLLKDPESAQFRDSVVIAPKTFDKHRVGVVCGEVNSKNSFGAYAGFSHYVVVAGIPAIEDGSQAFAHLWNEQCAHKPTL